MKKLFLTGILLASGFLLSVRTSHAQCNNVTASGTIGSNQSGCGSLNPSNIVNLTYPTGGTGTLQYQWQSSTDGNTWTDLSGATLESYDPPTITATRHFHRLERRSGCTAYTGTSNTVTKTVNPLPVASITAGGATAFCTGGSVTLTANAVAGTTYQWLKNGLSVGGATNQTYQATTPGTYQVRKTITATGCQASSNSISVTVHTPLTTTITDIGFNPCGASTAVLEVQGVAGATYQWYENSNILPGINSNQLDYGHISTYSCTIINSCGSYPSQPYTTNNSWLDFMPLGTITANGDTSICTGESVLLSQWMGFGGGQWYKDGVIINGATASDYLVTQPGNYGVQYSYYCWQFGTTILFYSNWIAVTSNGGTVPVPSISAGGSTTICQGGSVLLTEVTGPGWTYQWVRNGSAIGGATNSTYSATTAGSYLCNVSNICGTYASNTLVVSVQPNAVTVSISGPTTVCGGAFAPLSATSAGSGGSYQWKKNGSSISGATLSTYSASTTGSYSCSITNSCGTYNSNSISLTVSGTCGTGLLFDGLNDYSLVTNHANYSFGTGNFTVEAWVRLDPGQVQSFSGIVSNRLGYYNSPGFSIIAVQGIARFYMAGYNISGGPDLRDNTCHHIAATRTAAGVATLYVDGVQVATGTFPNVTLNGSTVYIGYDPNSTGYLKGYMMDVRLWNSARSQAQIQGSLNSQLTGNETGLVGYWKLNDGSGQSINDYTATNNDGRLGNSTNADASDPTFQATCAIAAAVNCNLPTGLSTTNITNTSAQLNWGGAAADSFLVRYAVHNTANFVWKKIAGLPNVTSTVITGLLPATQYDWWVRSLCNSGSSSNYQAVPATFTTTNTPVPCVVPYGLNASNIGNTSATISWTTMVTADTFRVRYSVNGTTNFIWKDVNGTGGSSTTLAGLSPNITYQFQVSSKCNGVTTAYSSSYIFTTLNTPVPCVKPYGLGATNIANTSVTVFWTNLVTADTFRIRYSVNNTTNFIWKDVNGAGGSSTTLANLVPNTAYQFQVSSKCNGVTSAYSSSYVFTTLNTPVPCVVPYGLSTTNITASSAQVNWTNLVTADTFRIRYSVNGTTNYIWKDVNGAGGATNTILTGLNASTTYQWQVRTICNGVSGPYSSSVLFTTAAVRMSGQFQENSIDEIAAFPNPADQLVFIQFQSAISMECRLTLCDLTGRGITSLPVAAVAGKNIFELDVADLPPGLYLVLIENGASSARIRIVVE